MKDLEYFKKELIKILDKKEREEKTEIKKSLAFTMDMLFEKSSSGYPVGTIREWKGKKYQKIAPGKWRRKYSSEEKGIRMSISALKKAIDKCASSQELLNLVLQNRDRFTDDKGRPLPIVKELSEYVSKKNDKIEKPKLMSNMKKVKDEVKHDGEYVLTNDGSKDFGEITPEIANVIKRQAGKIRLRIGEEHGSQSNNNYGEVHIERDSRLKQLKSAGFESARDFIEYVCKNFDRIYDNGMGLILAVRGEKNSKIAMIQLTPSPNNDFYDVKTGLVARNTYFKDKAKDGEEKRPLWVKPESGFESDNIGERRSPLQEEVPSATSGQPDNSNISQNNPPVKQKMTYALDVRKSVGDLTNYAKENYGITIKSEMLKSIYTRNKTLFVVKKSFADNFMNNRSIPALQKSIAVRGDFDAYRISDEELEEHSIFAKTEDGCEYDLQNPTEKFYYTLKKNLEKSLTWSGHKLQDRTSWNGLKISIENKKGSVRRGVDKDGHQWETKMHFDYGYIRGSEGTDGDHVDCYLGDNMDAKKVYIVHQNDPVTHKYDEDKCMLGFDTLEDAKKAYLMQYDRPGFLGKIDTMDFDEFKEFILLKRNHGKKIIKSYTDFVKSIGENFDFETMRKVCII